MPSAHCPRCGATYHVSTTTPNGPVCRYCIASGLIVVLLPIPTERAARRFSRQLQAKPDRTPPPKAAHRTAPLPPPRDERDALH